MSGMRPPRCLFEWGARSEMGGVHVCGEDAGHVGRHRCRDCPATAKREVKPVVRAAVHSRVERAHPLARELREVRLAAGLTQGEVAGRVGVTTGSLCGYECGQREPSLGVLTRWAVALGLEVRLVPPVGEVLG